MKAALTSTVPRSTTPTPGFSRWLWWPVLAVCLAANTYIALSGGVAGWWATESNSKSSSLPGPVQEVLSVRPATSEADVHVLLWFLAGLAAVFAVRTWRSRGVLIAALVAYSGLLEVAQTLTPSRTAQWTDFASNVVGIMSAALVVLLTDLFRNRA